MPRPPASAEAALSSLAKRIVQVAFTCVVVNVTVSFPYRFAGQRTGPLLVELRASPRMQMSVNASPAHALMAVSTNGAWLP